MSGDGSVLQVDQALLSWMNDKGSYCPNNAVRLFSLLSTTHFFHYYTRLQWGRGSPPIYISDHFTELGSLLPKPSHHRSSYLYCFKWLTIYLRRSTTIDHNGIVLRENCRVDHFYPGGFADTPIRHKTRDIDGDLYHKYLGSRDNRDGSL